MSLIYVFTCKGRDLENVIGEKGDIEDEIF
jgi:hypothetical protein